MHGPARATWFCVVALAASSMMTAGAAWAASSVAIESLLDRGHQDELVLFAIPSNARLNWSTPGSMLRSAVASYLKPTTQSYSKRGIGHVFVLLRSSSAPGPVLAGMTTGGHDEMKRLLLDEGYGLGLLAADVQGALDAPAPLASEVVGRCRTGKLTYLRFRLNPATSARLFRYYTEYRQRGCDRHYGGANRPRYGEGGGCSAFGVSFLEVGGLLRPEFAERWKVNVKIPRGLFGGPLHGTRVRVRSLAAAAFSRSRWATEDEPHVLCSLWDPTLIATWVRETHAAGGRSGGLAFDPEQTGKARGLSLDCRDQATPTEPIWLQAAACPNPYGLQPGLTHATTEVAAAPPPASAPSMEDLATR